MEIHFMRFLEQGVSQKALKKMYDPLIRSVLFWYMEELLRTLLRKLDLSQSYAFEQLKMNSWTNLQSPRAEHH